MLLLVVAVIGGVVVVKVVCGAMVPDDKRDKAIKFLRSLNHAQRCQVWTWIKYGTATENLYYSIGAEKFETLRIHYHDYLIRNPGIFDEIAPE